MEAVAANKNNQLVKWVNLNSAEDAELRLVRVAFPSGTKRLVLVGSKAIDDQSRAFKQLESIGFYKTRSGFLVRDDLTFTLSQIQKVFPKAVAAQIPVNEVIRIMPAQQSDTSKHAVAEHVVATNNAIMAAIPVGHNHHGQTVYAGEDGRFITDFKNNIIREADVMSAATFLYARSAEDMALCADGFVSEIASGKIYRFDDLKRFASVITEFPEEQIIHSPLLRKVQEAVEAGLVRAMGKSNRGIDRGAYNLALRLEEGQPPLNARTSDSINLQQFSTTLPIAVVAQRILGNASGKTVLEPTIGNGALVSMLPDTTVFGLDLDQERVSNVATNRKDATVAVGDATSARFEDMNGGEKFDIVISNPPFGGLQVGKTIEGLKITRVDHLILMRSLLARKDDGIGVYIIGADSYIESKAGQIAGGSRYLFNWLEDHYQVDAVEVDGSLYAKQGSTFPIRIVVVGKKGGERGQIRDTIPVVRDHDSLFEWSGKMLAKFNPATIEAGPADAADQHRPDMTYRTDGLFTTFLPQTPAGESAWRELAAKTDGTGKVLATQTEDAVRQLHEAGYTVVETTGVETTPEEDEELLNELTEPAQDIGAGEQQPHYSALPLKVLVDEYGWEDTGFDSVVKAFAGVGPLGGELVPDGTRKIYAGYRFDQERKRYISASLGDEELFDIDGRGRDPADIARELNAGVEAWVATRQNAPAGVKNTVDKTPEQNPAEQALIDAYVASFGDAADILNAAVAAVDWDAIKDSQTARAQTDKMYAAFLTGQREVIGKVSQELDAANINTWDERLSGLRSSAGYVKWTDAGQAYREASDKIQALAKERLIEAGKAELAALPKDAPLADIGRAIFRKSGIDIHEPPGIVAAIEAKSADLAWSALRNLENKASAEIFERATGIKLAKTQRDRRPQIDAWAGVTPAQRADLETMRTEQREAKERESSLKWAWNGLAALSVRTLDGNIQNGQDFIKGLFSQGFDQVTVNKRGAVLEYRLHDGERSTGVKNKSFSGFLKSAVSLGGLRQALEQLGEIEHKVEQTEADNQPAQQGMVEVNAPAQNAADLEENSYQSPYVARSRVGEATAMIPRNLATPTRNALGAVIEEYGDVDSFVASELGWTVDEMIDNGYLSPEQVDAVALAIHSIHKGRGFLEADQTGLGKGRVMAAMARYSALNNKPVIFITETPTLFTDFWRDIKDIGSDDLFTPMIVNDGVSIYDPITGKKLVSATPKSVIDQALKAGNSFDPTYNLILGTYSQFNRAASSSAKARWIADFAQGKALLLDEAHNAAGESNTGKNIGFAIDNAEYVVYSSATAMKAGKNVMIFSELFPETVDMGSLPQTLATGGEVLQEVLSGMLADDGVFVRREHDLSNLTFRTVSDNSRIDRNKELSDKLAEILEYMNYLAGDINVLVNERNREIKKILEKIPEAERKGNRMGAVSLNFGSRLFAIYRQFMMAVKTNLAAERAIQALEEGKKPVIVLENTMESLLSEVVMQNKPDMLDPEGMTEEEIAAALQGESVIDGDLTFRDVLYRMLDRLTYYNETGRYGDVTQVAVTSEGAMETMQLVRDLIAKFPDLSVSPLDEIKRRISEAGFVCDELSGRKLEIRQRGDSMVAAPIAERPKPQIVKDFVTGKSDALLLTRAGSTGISLHASEKFPDQRQRVMIELQSAADVNVRVQFFGRVNRKGQTSSPEIETLSSGLIGEARPIAMQNAKLRKLSANTTANQDNAALDRTVPDFINEIGDEVAFRYLEANPSIARRLDISLEAEEDARTAESFFINKLTSRLVMLRVAEQEQIYAALTNEYLRVIKELDAKGSNPLKSRELDVKAREVRREVFESGNPHSDSVFSQPVYVKTIEYEVDIQPIRSADVLSRIEQGKKWIAGCDINREGRENEQFFKALRDFLLANRMKFLESVLSKDMPSVDAALAAKDPNAAQKMQHRLNVLINALGNLYVGAVAKFTNDEGDVDFGIVTRVLVPDNPKHIHLLGAYELGFAVPGKQNLVERTLYSLQDDAAFRIMPKSAGAEKDVMDRFDRAEAGRFKMQRLILDGNLFKAAQIAASSSLGSSVIYTDEHGSRHRGVLLSRGVDMKHLNSLAVRLESPAMCASILGKHPELAITTATGTHDRDVDAMITIDGGVARLEVPGTKAWGGRYFGNDELISAAGKFSGSRTVMVATFSAQDLEKVVSVIYKSGISLYAPSSYREAINELNNSIYTNDSLNSKLNVSNSIPGMR